MSLSVIIGAVHTLSSSTAKNSSDNTMGQSNPDVLHFSHSNALNLHLGPESGNNLFIALRFSANSAFLSAIFR
ncbi:UNVERIFIED_CONTAM: hypothetical protein NCL1_50206 [Trichonephila clavipes]